MKLLLNAIISMIILFNSCVIASEVNSDVSIKSIQSDLLPHKTYHFASIEFLIEQEVGRIVLPKIYNNIGLKAEVTPLPGNRAQYVANSGISDGEIMRIWSYGDENPNTIRVSTPYYYLETMPFVLKNSNITIKNQHDLKKYRLSKVRGVKHTNNITKGLSQVYDMSTTADMFKLLLNGKVDVVLTNTLDGALTLSRLGLNEKIVSLNPLARLPLFHYIHKKHKHLVPVINQAIINMQATGELTEVILAAEAEVIQQNKIE